MNDPANALVRRRPEPSAFRQTLLCRFPGPERRTLVRLGAMFEELAGEIARYEPEGSGESAVRTLLRAAAADLRCDLDWLAMVARQQEESEVGPEDAPLCALAAAQCAVLAAVAETLEAAVEVDAEP